MKRRSKKPTEPVPAVETRSRTGWGVADRWLELGIFFATVLAYWPALNGTFIWDDDGHITRIDLRAWDGLGRIWFELGATQQYYPVLHSAFWLEHFAFGDVPLGYHVLNVLLHATASCLFARALRRLEVPGYWLAGLLFALHPVAVESVAWISEQKNTLSTVFYLLAALVYVRFDGTRLRRHYAGATLFFLLALGTKTVTSTLPAALLVVFWWRRGRLDLRRDLVPLAPWFVLAIAAGLLTAWVEHTLVGALHNEFNLDLVERGLLASRVIWFYLGKLVYPADLIFIYPRWTIDAGEAWQYLFPAGILVLAFAAWKWRRQRGAIAAGLFFVGSLFPALGFVNVYPFVYSFVADHFQYLASLGILALAGALVTRVLGRWTTAQALAAVGGLLTLLGVLTWRQSATYRNVFALYEHTLASNPAAWMAHTNLGNALTDIGRTTEAISHLEAALKLRPTSAEVENSLGFALLKRKDLASAIPHFEQAIRLRSDYVFAYNNLGLALLNIGQLEAAEARLRQALKLKSDYPEANFNLGLTLRGREKTIEAIDYFETAARLRPGNVEAELNLAICLALSQRTPEALPHFERAVRLAPKRADIRTMFGSVLALAQRPDEAISQFRAALELNPNLAEAHANLADVLRQTGRTDEANRHFAESVRLGGGR